ncbi:hypothetical protein ACQPZJ_47125 [Actinoplanes sp. CA-054009]
MAGGFGVLASLSPGDGYVRLAIALVVIGAGSGTAGPAAYGTLLGALPPDRVGVGSAVNDTVQQVGTALSVAVLGSVLTAAYRGAMPSGTPEEARRSIGDALGLAASTGDAALARLAQNSFVEAISTTALVGVVGGVIAAMVAAAVLRPKPAPSTPSAPTAPSTPSAPAAPSTPSAPAAPAAPAAPSTPSAPTVPPTPTAPTVPPTPTAPTAPTAASATHVPEMSAEPTFIAPEISGMPVPEGADSPESAAHK